MPAELLGQKVEILRRRGVDLNPVDVETEDGARLLECFVWADQHERLERLRRAIELLRRESPELIQGDFVDLLPRLLAEREPRVLTVVFQTAATAYLPRERYDELRAALDAAGAAGPLAWISTRRREEDEESRDDSDALELVLWPDAERRVVARMGFHGRWLEWRG